MPRGPHAKQNSKKYCLIKLNMESYYLEVATDFLRLLSSKLQDGSSLRWTLPLTFETVSKVMGADSISERTICSIGAQSLKNSRNLPVIRLHIQFYQDRFLSLSDFALA